MPIDMLGNEVKTGDWIIFGTRVGNSAETRIAKVIDAGPGGFRVSSIRFPPGNPKDYMFSKVSGTVNPNKCVRLAERPF